MHLVRAPVPFVLSAICPGVLTIARYVIVVKVTVIGVPVSPTKLSLALLSSSFEETFVLCSVLKLFDAEPVLLVV